MQNGVSTPKTSNKWPLCRILEDDLWDKAEKVSMITGAPFEHVVKDEE